MSQVNFDNLSDKELQKLIEDSDRVLRENYFQRAYDLRKEALALAASLNISLDELLGIRKGKTSAIKYRNPENPDQTWSGLARRPGWLKEALERGEPLEKFAV